MGRSTDGGSGTSHLADRVSDYSTQINSWRSNTLLMNQLSVVHGDHPNLGRTTVAPGAVGPDGTLNTTSKTFIPYDPATVITGTPNQWFNPLMFTMNPIGYMGSAGRGILRGPHLANFDFSVNKDTKAPFLGENGKVVFRAEFFNIFNHLNFGLPSQFIYAGTLTDVGLTSKLRYQAEERKLRERLALPILHRARCGSR